MPNSVVKKIYRTIYGTTVVALLEHVTAAEHKKGSEHFVQQKPTFFLFYIVCKSLQTLRMLDGTDRFLDLFYSHRSAV